MTTARCSAERDVRCDQLTRGQDQATPVGRETSHQSNSPRLRLNVGMKRRPQACLVRRPLPGGMLVARDDGYPAGVGARRFDLFEADEADFGR